MSSALDLLEMRLKTLEDRLLSQRNNGQQQQCLTDQLLQIDGKLKELTAGKDRFNNCYKKCRQLDKYLDTEYIDRLTATDSSKLEQIVNFEDQIKEESTGLERVDQLSSVIDLPHLRDFDKFDNKLNGIRLIGLSQSQESAKIGEKSRQLLLTYNEWLDNIKQQLQYWDQVITDLEVKHKSRNNTKRS
ncbi:dynactin subunit 3-like [Oppia nitens]|uniref:dynactin subunit 3-like n=1 Tax=Oppia nitens TaxID=1686743 RepID=UPI0023D9D1E9|nr:dynactin subunit 3-like [Oppia nitens]